MIIPMMSNEIFINSASIGDINSQIEALEYRLDFAKSVGNDAAAKKIEEEIESIKSTMTEVSEEVETDTEETLQNENVTNQDTTLHRENGIVLWRYDDTEMNESVSPSYKWSENIAYTNAFLSLFTTVPNRERNTFIGLGSPVSLVSLVHHGPEIYQADYYGHEVFVEIIYRLHQTYPRITDVGPDEDCFYVRICVQIDASDRARVERSREEWIRDVQARDEIVSSDMENRYDQNGNLIPYGGTNEIGWIIVNEDNEEVSTVGLFQWEGFLDRRNFTIPEALHERMRRDNLALYATQPIPERPGIYICKLIELENIDIYAMKVRAGNEPNGVINTNFLVDSSREPLENPPLETIGELLIYRADDPRTMNYENLVEWDSSRMTMTHEMECEARTTPVPIGMGVNFYLKANGPLSTGPSIVRGTYYYREVTIATYYMENTFGERELFSKMMLSTEEREDLESIVAENSSPQD